MRRGVYWLLKQVAHQDGSNAGAVWKVRDRRKLLGLCEPLMLLGYFVKNWEYTKGYCLVCSFTCFCTENIWWEVTRVVLHLQLQVKSQGFQTESKKFFSGQFLLKSQAFTATIEIYRVQCRTSQVSEQSNPIQDDRGAIRPRQRILGYWNDMASVSTTLSETWRPV